METEHRDIVRVFLASPGDLADERQIAKEVVEKLNRQVFNKFFNLHIELMGWEDTIGTFGKRPQEVINEELARCELFVGMLWHEWGTSNTGRYSSGFEEEFRLAEASFRDTGRPTIAMLFKTMDSSRLRDPGQGLRRVLEFKEEIRTKLMWGLTFEGEAQFRDRLETVLTDYVKRLTREKQREQPNEAPGIAADTPTTQTAADQATENPQLPQEALSFVHDFADQAARDADSRPVTAPEIARFRLLGTLLSQQGNDEMLIGVHDANTLFLHADELSLAWREYAALAECGLVNFDSQNAPLWRWLVAADAFDGSFIPLRTIVGSEKLRLGTFKLMRLMNLSRFDDQDLNREFYVKTWLSEDTPKAVREAALGYLSDFGIAADLGSVREEVERADYQTLKAAIHAYASILSRESAEKALQALLDHQSDAVEASLVAKIFERPSLLPTPLLEQAASHRANEIRRLSLVELTSRGKATRELAERLVEDVDPDVRLAGLLARTSLGDRISHQDARTVLVKRKVRSGFYNALAIGSPSSTEGEAQLAAFSKQQLEKMPRPQLKREADKASIFDQEFVLEEMRRSFKSRGSELRNAIKDRFVQWFIKALAELEAIVGQSETLERTKKLESKLRNDWIRKALSIVLAQDDCQDLPLVRELVTTDDELLTVEVVQYLAKCGEWMDVDLIRRFSDAKPSRSVGLLGYLMPVEEEDATVSALLELGKRRGRDLMDLELSERIRARLIAGLPPSQFREFSNDDVSEFLQSENQAVRRAAALKAVALLPLSRLKDLMKRHLDPEERRYYNVSVWLDLGVSLPRPTSSAIAKRALRADGD